MTPSQNSVIAGQQSHVVSLVVGHAAGRARIPWGGTGKANRTALLRAVVEVVKLPVVAVVEDARQEAVVASLPVRPPPLLHLRPRPAHRVTAFGDGLHSRP